MSISAGPRITTVVGRVLHDQGWVWVPGREWGPAWVSWRTGGDYRWLGAAMPPRRGGGGEVVHEGSAGRLAGSTSISISGLLITTSWMSATIGEPVLRDRIFQPEQNVTYISRTVNVTNITYTNSTWYYNHGPDYNRLSAYSTRWQIPRLTIERESNADLKRGGAFRRSHQGAREPIDRRRRP